MTTPPDFDPQPCTTGSGAAGADLENLILCDVAPDGTLFGTALAVYNYTNGVATGAPTFVNPVTGLAYVPQGVLQPCPGETGCLEPVTFHRTTTTTSPVDHPGRQYDLTLPINPGFAVQSLQVDQVTNAANIVWDVADPDGEQFRQDLTTFIDGRVPSAATVTITNPNAGQTICGTAAPMQVHIECLRLDQSPPDLIELVYNGGRDMVINPAYNETPPLSPPVSQGNYGFHLLGRQDDPGPFPGNPPANRANCTNVANRGWETNDIGRTFEIWGQDIVQGSAVTPTPRGTPVQEITSDGPPPGGRSTIWQTFQAPASGNFVIRVVHGARDGGENHIITLDNGDTDDAQNGDLINNVTTNVGVVTNSAGGPGPWTTFAQTLPLTSGNTYTLALSTNNPAGGARGGLFTDMRAYIDRPDLRATATVDDATCVVSVTETSTLCADELWSPLCENGTIVSWQNSQTSAILSNAAFWGQAPAPIPGTCPASAAGGGSGSVAANLAYTYPVCATVGGVRTNLQRVVIADGSGGVLADSFIGTDGGPVATPSSYTIGSCTDTAFMTDLVLCDAGTLQPDGSPTPFLRKFVQAIGDTGQPQVKAHEDFTLDGAVLFTPVGPVGTCFGPLVDQEVVCWTQTSTGTAVHTGTIRHDDRLPSPGWLLFDQHVTPVPPTEPGLTFVPCGGSSADTEVLTLCDVVAGTPVPFLRRLTFDNGNLTMAAVDTTPAGAPYVVAGTVSVCTELDAETQVLCDSGNANHPYVWRITYNAATGLAVGTGATNLDGSAYAVVGVPVVCGPGTDAEPVILCDSSAVPVRFLRSYRYGPTGAVTGFADTTLAGAAFVPTGAVGVCATSVTNDTDFVEEVMSDANGTCFLRLFRFNSATGALISVTNTTLAGAAFAPVGAVTAGCSSCCPVVLGEGCTNVGSGRYSAIRAANGTISLIDSVSGAAVLAANIITCPGDDVVKTLSAQARVLTNATPWTPGGDVVGVLTSLTVTGTAGLWDMVDASGTVLTGLPAGLTITFNAEDDNTLTGPTSVTPQAGATVVASWTER